MAESMGETTCFIKLRATDRFGLAPTSCQSRSPRSTRNSIGEVDAGFDFVTLDSRFKQQTPSCRRENHHMPRDHGPETSRCTHSSRSSFHRLGTSGQVGSYPTLFRIRLRLGHSCCFHIPTRTLLQGSEEARCGRVGVQIPSNCCVHRS